MQDLVLPSTPDTGRSRRNCDVGSSALLARTGGSHEPPYAPRIPAKLIHLCHLVLDMAYVAPRAPDEMRTNFKRRMYTVLLRLAMNGSPPSGMRIVRKFPLTNWDQVWKNLHACPVTDEIKSTWYKAMHDLLPTNDRLAAIHLTDTTLCSSCGHPDSLQHRITE
jgi:hypothetical protein